MKRNVRLTAGLIFIMAILSGCQSEKVASPASVRVGASEISDAARRLIYARVWDLMERVALFKPDAAGHEPMAVQLAPLLLQDARTGKKLSPHRVLYHTNSITIAGKLVEQRTFEWPNQSVRLTLDSSGHPAIWEVRHDSSGADIIWVSQRLEMAAGEQFGKALPGRSFSIERSRSEAPWLVVPSVVDDGPVPMGPMAYLSANGDVPLLTCRCSAFNAKTLEEGGIYELNRTDGKRRSSGPETGDWWDPSRLEKRLRLPSSF
ncbi:MAG TPA: hypothetical protein VEH04_05520 [Verrucomicrobiae bacterium]|nr:hypothetical protein [Verrucomicrobiae bacterium]